MNYNIYSIYDRKAGVYAAPFLSHNDDTAVRQFQYQLSRAEMVALDCELFRLGSFDSSVGVIISTKPEFIVSYQEVKA